MSKAIKATVFLKDLVDFAKMNAVYERALQGHTPARSNVEVTRLPLLASHCLTLVSTNIDRSWFTRPAKIISLPSGDQLGSLCVSGSSRINCSVNPADSELNASGLEKREALAGQLSRPVCHFHAQLFIPSSRRSRGREVMRRRQEASP